jgi:hypothetical protein
MNAQLIDVETGGHLWAKRFETDRRNLAEAENEITGCVTRTLNLELVEAGGRRIERETLLAPVYGWFNQGFETADLKEAKNLVDEFAWLLGQRGWGAAVKIPANLGEAYFTCRNNRAGCPSRCRSPSLRRPGGPRNRGRYCTHQR